MIGNFVDLVLVFFFLIGFLEGVRKRNQDLAIAITSAVLALAGAFLTYLLTAHLLMSGFGLKEAYARVLGFFLNATLLRLLLDFLLEKLYRRALLQKGKEISIGAKRALTVFLSSAYAVLKIFVLMAILVALTLPTFLRLRIDESRAGSYVRSDPLRVNARFEEVFGGLFGALLEDLEFLSIKTGEEDKVELGFETVEIQEVPEEEEAMLELVNKERTERGLKPLTMDAEARRAARDYGRYLFKNGMFSHIDLEGKGPAERMKNYEVEAAMIGENLAYVSDLDDPRKELSEAHRGLMNSKGHRENILHPLFGRIGIGVIDAGPYGEIYVQEFLG